MAHSDKPCMSNAIQKHHGVKKQGQVENTV